MTKEDIKNICQIYDNLRRERDAATIAYNSEDMFWEHVLTTYNFSQPSLPNNLDEAAREIVIKMHPCLKGCTILGDRLTRGQLMDLVKAGAEWAIQQLKGE